MSQLLDDYQYALVPAWLQLPRYHTVVRGHSSSMWASDASRHRSSLPPDVNELFHKLEWRYHTIFTTSDQNKKAKNTRALFLLPLCTEI